MEWKDIALQLIKELANSNIKLTMALMAAPYAPDMTLKMLTDLTQHTIDVANEYTHLMLELCDKEDAERLAKEVIDGEHR